MCSNSTGKGSSAWSTVCTLTHQPELKSHPRFLLPSRHFYHGIVFTSFDPLLFDVGKHRNFPSATRVENDPSCLFSREGVMRCYPATSPFLASGAQGLQHRSLANKVNSRFSPSTHHIQNKHRQPAWSNRAGWGGVSEGMHCLSHLKVSCFLLCMCTHVCVHACDELLIHFFLGQVFSSYRRLSITCKRKAKGSLISSQPIGYNSGSVTTRTSSTSNKRENDDLRDRFNISIC